MPRIRLPKWPAETKDWISNFIREFQAYDQKTLHRELDFSKSIKATDGQGGNFFLQQVKPKVKILTLSGASVTIANMIPAGVIVYGVWTTITTAITGATGYDVGTPFNTTAWAQNAPVTKGTKTNFANYLDRSVSIFPTAVDVVITAEGSNFTGGQIEVVLHYSDFVN